VGIERLEFVVPEKWDATWFRRVFVAEILSKLDTRNATGTGVTVSSNGNSVATLATDVTQGTVDANIAAHVAATDPHPDLIDDLTAVTAVAEADLVVVSQSGTNKKATVDQLAVAVFGEEWDDMLTVGTGIDPPGGVADPSRSTTTGLLEFSGTLDNVIVGEWQMSHQWKPGIVRPHIHARFPTSTATDSRWKFEYDAASVNGDFTNASGTLTTLSTITVANPQNVKKHAVAGFGDLDLTGFKESTVILWRITRLASSDAADTYGGVVELLSVDLHYQKNKAGTEAEYPT
jgi:hypothetical protein